MGIRSPERCDSSHFMLPTNVDIMVESMEIVGAIHVAS